MSLLRSLARPASFLSLLVLSAGGALAACSSGEDAATAEETGESGGQATAGKAGASGKSQGGSTQSGGASGKFPGSAGGPQPGGAAGSAQGGATGGGGSAAGGSSPGGSSPGGGSAGEATAGGGGQDPGSGGSTGEAGQGAGGGETAGAGSGPVGSGGAPGSAGMGQAGGGASEAKFEVEMTFTTANVGRDYQTKSDVQPVFNKIEGVIGGKSGPRFIGWQEIGEADPCGDSCEIDSLKASFPASANWETYQPKGERPDGGKETVKVPITAKGAASGDVQVRAVFASSGWAGVSPTRFITVVFHADRNVSTINTHFIAGAWSCKSEPEKRREYWKKAWAVLKDEVAKEHGKGRNVIVTGDLNRDRTADSCNPAWEPTSLHPDAKIVGGAGIDYIFAVPSEGHKFTIAKTDNGTPKEGTITLGIDGHKAHWVTGQFLSK